MTRIILAILASISQATKIVYLEGLKEQYATSPDEFPMIFKWPEGDFRCGATMISPQVALTAAHCIEKHEDGANGELTIKLNSGNVHTIREFRTNECWDFSDDADYSADIALMILETPIEDAELGTDYINVWNPEAFGDMTGREFTLAGWGSSGEVQEEGMSEDHFDSEVYHSGENVVNQISDNMLQYTFDAEADGGLATEAMGHFGDSGSGALVRHDDGTLHIAGVKSNGEDGFFGSSHEYTRAGGITRAWIHANLDSLDARVPVESCDAYTGVVGAAIFAPGVEAETGSEEAGGAGIYAPGVEAETGGEEAGGTTPVTVDI